MIKNKTAFYTLSFTWGILMTLVGCVVALVLLATGYKSSKHGYCWHFKVGNKWGGVNLGPVFLTDNTPTEHTKNHEHGHALQNCKYGPFMVVVSLMSAARYWYREFKYYKKGLKPPTKYDDAWYEGEATKLGDAFFIATKEN